MKILPRLYKVYHVDRTKNGKVIQFAPLELEINGHTEKIDIVVTDLNGMDMFLKH